ncbi:transcription factor [Ganoderma sinense ZZ0214-1]|uniref:Transcription factor n=1 Tax=Ganoderma sinense ZZ0214-1 TaxID=1077348 RepID=A0A2G8SN61_9APHY|nr:transcription factor [Ganoderma sinense ZZ0214-1]
MFDESIAWLDSILDVQDTSNGFLSVAPSSEHLLSPQGSSFAYPSPLSEDQHSPYRLTRSVDSPSSSTTSQSQSPSPQPPAADSSLGTPSSAPAPATKPPRRRIRPKIALDPNQPLTARGKQRARVYVACDQCRIRKTRCDGAKPPKRRGQDKVPGTRVRTSTHHKSKRRKTSSGTDDDDSGSESSSPGSPSPPCESTCGQRQPDPQLHATYDNFPGLYSDGDGDGESDEYDPFPLVDLDGPNAETEYSLGRYAFQKEPAIPARPSIEFTRDTWWDALLTFYSTDLGTIEAISLSADQRSDIVVHIISDLRALFHSSVYWVSFIHLPRFFDRLLNPKSRATMQPSFIMSALAIGLFTQSSEAERGAAGRVKALKLVELAHSSLQASMASGWVDVELIQAAWLMTYFELQSHPKKSVERGRSAMLLLDSLIRLFSLTTLDSDVKRAYTTNRPSMVSQNAAQYDPPMNDMAPMGGLSTTNHIDILLSQAGLQPNPPPSAASHVPVEPLIPDNMTLGPATASSPLSGCTCGSLTLEKNWPGVNAIAPTWAGTLVWPENLPDGEFKKEECRRLVWASVMITASLNAYSSTNDIVGDIHKNQLWIKNPENFALLFPAESLALHGTSVHANNLWTLHLRSMLLLDSCVCKRGDVHLTNGERAQFAMQAWLEIDAIEHALGQHTCELERNFGFQAREMLFSARMCVSHEFQRYIPCVTTSGSMLFYRDKAEEWLTHRMQFGNRLWQDMQLGIQSLLLDFRKPMLIYWFMSHVIKGLVLWEADPTLAVALETGKTFAVRVEHLMLYWPSEAQRREWEGIRMQLVQSCLKAGVPLPSVSIPGAIPRMNAKS